MNFNPNTPLLRLQIEYMYAVHEDNCITLAEELGINLHALRGVWFTLVELTARVEDLPAYLQLPHNSTWEIHQVVIKRVLTDYSLFNEYQDLARQLTEFDKANPTTE